MVWGSQAHRVSNPSKTRPAVNIIAVGILFLATFLERAIPVNAAASGPVGSVKEIRGTVELTRSGRKTVPTESSDVYLNDQFTTGLSSSASIALIGGNQLEVGPSSSITIDQVEIGPAPAAGTMIGLVTGRLRSIVHAIGAGGTGFGVRTANAVCGVRGTDFNVRFSQGFARPGFGGCGTYTDVEVFSGVVEVANSQNRTTTAKVNQGYATTVPCLHAPLTPGPVGLAAIGVTGAPATSPPPPACPPCMAVGARLH